VARLTKVLPGTVLRAEVLRSAYDRFRAALPPHGEPPEVHRAYVDHGGEAWDLDEPGEFFAFYDEHAITAQMSVVYADAAFSVAVDGGSTTVFVHLPQTEKVRHVIGSVADAPRVEEVGPLRRRGRPTRVFIGHGRSPQWRQLSDHLRQHGFEVITYEAMGRPGEASTDVLRRILASATAAVLVHTGDHLDDRGGRHACPNVVHETGLLQGRLGLDRVVVVREDGCETFANIAAYTDIRFPQGDIDRVVANVIDALERLPTD
jgi:hypothetical protein